MSKVMVDIINHRFKFMEDVKELALATMSHPRYKRLGFRDKQKAE